MDKSFWGKKNGIKWCIETRSQGLLEEIGTVCSEKFVNKDYDHKGLKSALAIRLYVFEIRWQSWMWADGSWKVKLALNWFHFICLQTQPSHLRDHFSASPLPGAATMYPFLEDSEQQNRKYKELGNYKGTWIKTPLYCWKYYYESDWYFVFIQKLSLFENNDNYHSLMGNQLN